ncbi:cytochrome c biogenesis protein [Flavobacteriales bacterium]|nr:cytochrome c biogenesis protein [Flavobacteriales bacterium]
MKAIKKHWWKALAVILLVYTMLFSFLIPLSPTIKSASPSSLEIGNNRIVLTGYNTNFQEGEIIDASIEFGKKTLVCGKNIKVLSPNMISAEFNVPESLPSKVLHVRLNTTRFSSFSPELVKAFTIIENNDTNNLCMASRPFGNSAQQFDFPNRLQLNETIRNLMFHVPMWFTMMIILGISVVCSIIYLFTFNIKWDIFAREAVNVGLLFAFLGLITGSIWAKFTWSEHTDLFTTAGWWVNDVKLNGAAITTLIYLAYRILRNSLQEDHQKAKVSGVYNIFAFVLMVVFLIILPRLTDSLHPGNGGNPAFGKYDLDNTMRMVFYPAVIGWILLGIWMVNLKKRISNIENTLDYE